MCAATFLHEHCRLRGGPFDGQVKSGPLRERPTPYADFEGARLDTGEVVYPPPLPGGPFGRVRYRPVLVRYRLLLTNFDPGGSDTAVESWPHRDDDGMLVYVYEKTETIEW